MANQQHLDILKQGIKIWNEWRKQYPEIQPDLSEAILNQSDLSEADLSEANLKGASLKGANLRRANGSGANLCRAILKEAYLGGSAFLVADLIEADLTEADLSYSSFSEADLTDANLKGAKLIDTNLSGTILFRANLSGADLSGARLVRTNLMKATLADCRIYGISVWDIQLQEALQNNLIITLPNQPTISVDNLEVAQFIYLLLNHKKLRDVLNSVMERGVLLLGRFNDGGLALLQAIAAKLRDMKYLPIIFDFDRPDSRNLTETVMTLVGLSRFVIVDLSGRSVANELRSAVPHFKIPFVPIIEERRKKEIYSMFSDFLEADWVLPLVVFRSKDHLVDLLSPSIIEPAEKRCEERQRRLKDLLNR